MAKLSTLSKIFLLGLLSFFALFTAGCPNLLNDPMNLKKKIVQDVKVATADSLTLTVETDPNGISTPSGTLTVKESIPQDISTNVFATHAFINWVQTGGNGIAEFENPASEATRVTVTKGAVTIKPVFEIKPKVLYSTPIGSSIPKNSRVTIVFSKTLDPLTVTDDTLTITENGTGPSLTGEFTITSNTISFSPDSPFNSYKTYVINATVGIKDSLGLSLFDTYTSAFKTGNAFDNEPPDKGEFVLDGGFAYTKNREVMLNNIWADDDSEISLIKVYNETDDSGGFQDFATSLAWTLSAGDGEKTVNMLFQDLLGNTTPEPVFRNIILDTTPPTATILLENNATFTKSETVNLVVSAVDPGAGTKDGSGMGTGLMTLSNDAAFTGAITEDYDAAVKPWTVSSGDGLKTVYGKFTDSIGNETAEPVSATIYLDTTPPTGTINGGLTVATNNPTVTVSLALSDGEGSGAGAVKLTASDVANGTNAWTSSAGNTGDISGGAFTAWAPAAARFTFNLSSGEGIKSINFMIADKAEELPDNANISTITSTILYDVLAPTLSSITVNGGAASTNNAAVTVAINLPEDNFGLSNITHVGLSNNDADFENPTWLPYSSPAAWTIGDGSNIVYAKLRDAAGNVSATVASTAITLDTAPPTGGFTINSNATYAKSTAVTLTSAASGSPAKMRFSNDNVTWPDWSAAPAYNASYEWTLSSGDGTKTVYGQYRDGSGNDSAVTTDTIILDTSIPSGTITILGTGDGTNMYTNTLTSVSVSVAGSDTGSGVYRMQFSTDNGLTWFPEKWSAYTTTYSGLTLAYSAGNTYTLQCQIRDRAGNVSTVISDTIIYDNVPPSISAFSVNNGSDWTNNPAVTLNSTATDALSGVYQMSISTTSNTSGFSAWETYTAARAGWSVANPTAEETKHVWIKIRDRAGKESTVATDTIGLDLTAPTIASIAVNGGAATTPSLQSKFTLTSADTGGSGLYQYQEYYNGTFGSWKTLPGTSLTADFGWPFATNAGTHYVYLRVKDNAGNMSLWQYDTITLEVPTLQYARKGYNTGGSTWVYGTPVAAPSGTNSYYIYSTTDAAANPNTGSPVTSLGTISLTLGTLSGSVASPAGELRYFFIRAYNFATGGWGPYSALSVPGWSADVTVIYNDNNAPDIAVAQSIKTLLETNLPSTNTDVNGTQLTRKVILIPQTMVPTSFISGTTTEAYYKNIIYGDPVIVTPACSLYSNLNQTRNLVGGYQQGIIGMGFGGTKLLDTINGQWSAWGLTGQQPADIGRLKSDYYADSTQFGYTWTTSNTIWTSPVYSAFIPGHNTSVQLTYSGAPFTTRYSVYRLAGAALTGGWLYERDTASANNFTVAQQGRFLHYGYTILPDRPVTGKVFFINLVERMDDY